MEKLKRDACSSILAQWRQLLMEALASRSGLAAVTPQARTLAAARTSGTLNSDISALTAALEALQGNASPGAVCGRLLWMLSSHVI